VISILDIGGNYGSLLAAFEKIGVPARVDCRDASNITAAAYVLPGVGRADNAMEIILEKGWYRIIPQTTRPVLGICCGFHVMCAHSQEGDVGCLGIFPWHVKKQPQARFGWEETEDGWMYFCHLYGIPAIGGGIMHKRQINNFTGVQFHPEKSSDAGLEFLRKWASQ